MPHLKPGDSSVEISDLGLLDRAWILTGDPRTDPGAIRYLLQLVEPGVIFERRKEEGDNPRRGVPQYIAIGPRGKLELWPAADQKFIFGANYFPPMKSIE